MNKTDPKQPSRWQRIKSILDCSVTINLQICYKQRKQPSTQLSDWKLKSQLQNDEYMLDFRGYWRAVNSTGVPNEPGIFCVYASTYNPETRGVTLKKLVYVGESDRVQDFIYDYEQIEDWFNRLEEGEEICFSFASLPPENYSEDERKLIASVLARNNGEIPILFPDNFELPPNASINIKTDGENSKLDKFICASGNVQNAS